MQMYRNVEFYNEILLATSAIATYTPAKEGSNYTAGSEFFNGEPIFAEIVEFGAQTPSNITGPYYYDAREALWHGDHQHHSPGRRRGYRAGHCRGYGELHHGLDPDGIFLRSTAALGLPGRQFFPSGVISKRGGLP